MNWFIPAGHYVCVKVLGASLLGPRITEQWVQGETGVWKREKEQKPIITGSRNINTLNSEINRLFLLLIASIIYWNHNRPRCKDLMRKSTFYCWSIGFDGLLHWIYMQKHI